MRDVVITAVGDNGREVGQLQRRAAQRILPDGERNDRQRIPRPAVLAVVPAPVGDIPVALVEEVGTQLAAETEALDILFPGIVPFLDVPVFGIVQDIAEDIAEIGIARSRHGKTQVERRGMRVALHTPAPRLVALVADMQIRRPEYPLLQTDQALHQLEGRTRRVFGPHGTVIQGLAFVAQHLHVVVAALAPHQLVGIVRRRGNHHQDLPRGRFDRHGRPDLAAHEFFAQQLQAGVDGADDIFAGLGQRIINAVHVGALDGPVSVDLLDLHPLRSPQQRFVGRLHAAHAHVVADLIFGIPLEVIGIHLAHIPQQVTADFTRITADGAVNRIETAEIALIETEFVLFRNIVGHDAGRTGAHPGIGQLFFEFPARKSQHVAHAHGIEPMLVDLAVNHHQVVALAALNQVFAVAVEHLAARRVLHHMAQHIGLGQFVVFRIDKLNIGQAAGDQQEDEKHHPLQGTHPHEALGTFHMRTGSLAVKMRAMTQMKATDTAPLATVRTIVRTICAHESASSEKNTAWCTSTSTIR